MAQPSTALSTSSSASRCGFSCRPMSGMRLTFGSLCIGVHCADTALIDSLRGTYRPFLTDREPEFTIELSVRSQLTLAEVKQVLAKSKSSLDAGKLTTNTGLLECRVDWSKAKLWVETERELLSPLINYRLMNTLLRGIYAGFFGRVRMRPPDAYLVHGCGIGDGERGYLFTGPSGAGKSTVARLAGDRTVLNDETVLVGRDQYGFRVQGTPFDGAVEARSNASRRLCAAFFLKHDKAVTLRKLGKVETYTRLLTQIFDTPPLFEDPGEQSLQERADLAVAMAKVLPAYELGFLPDGSFWPSISELQMGAEA